MTTVVKKARELSEMLVTGSLPTGTDLKKELTAMQGEVRTAEDQIELDVLGDLMALYNVIPRNR